MSTKTPLVSDRLVKFDNKPDEGESDTIIELNKNSTCIITTSLEVKPEIEFKQLLRKNMWEAHVSDEFVLGQIGEKTNSLKRDSAQKDKKIELNPHIPNWSGVSYHPKLADVRNIHSIKKRKNKVITPHYIFGNDDRQIYYPDSYPWRCVGKIFVWDNPNSSFPQWSGSGALVGENIVLTASHVCPWDADPWMMQFIPAYYDGISLLGTGITSYVQSIRGYRDHGQGDDMAVLKLYNPLGKNLGWFGSKTYSDDWEDGNYWTKCGYPGAIASGQRPSKVTWFPVIDDDNDGAGVELEYKADSSPGGSGGPVFGWWGENNPIPYIIGTHSGGEEEYQFPFSIIKNNLAAGGNALPKLIKWAQKNW